MASVTFLVDCQPHTWRKSTAKALKGHLFICAIKIYTIIYCAPICHKTVQRIYQVICLSFSALHSREFSQRYWPYRSQADTSNIHVNFFFFSFFSRQNRILSRKQILTYIGRVGPKETGYSAWIVQPCNVLLDLSDLLIIRFVKFVTHCLISSCSLLADCYLLHITWFILLLNLLHIVRSVQFAAHRASFVLYDTHCSICFSLFIAWFVALCLICLIMSNKSMGRRN